MRISKTHLILIAILLIAALLRFALLHRGDPLNDEVLIGFRAIGLIDFDEAKAQTTPFEWFDDKTAASSVQIPDGYRRGGGIPWWAYLSWHDHPPLVFYIQHASFAIFGENMFGLRFPSAALGVIATYVVYLIGKTLYTGAFGLSVGLISALFFAVSLNNVYISRTGMQESYVIFFLLLLLYFLLRGFKNNIYLVWSGVVLGLGALTKYTILFAGVPIIFLIIATKDRTVFFLKRFWISFFLAALFFVPVIIYNIMLYRAVGHFDFQFSAILFQYHPAWQVQPGKAIGTFFERVTQFPRNMIATHSWLFVGLWMFSVLGFLSLVYKKGRDAFYEHSALVVGHIILFLLLLGIGPSYRFLTMLTPFMALSTGVSLSLLQKNNINKYSRATIIVIILCFELFYTYNNQIAFYPKGHEPLLASKVRYENYNWGYNELSNYFEQEFAGKMPAFTFDLHYRFLDVLRDRALERAFEEQKTLYPALVVHYGNFDKAGKLWTLDRLHIYHAWPMIDLDTYYQYMREHGEHFYQSSGFRVIYFVIPTNTTLSPEFQTPIVGLNPISVKNPRGDIAFLVYKKTLHE